MRSKITPDDELVFEFFASSWEEAMTRYHEWQGWEPYKPIHGFENDLYSEAQHQEQVSTGHHIPILEVEN